MKRNSLLFTNVQIKSAAAVFPFVDASFIQICFSRFVGRLFKILKKTVSIFFSTESFFSILIIN